MDHYFFKNHITKKIVQVPQEYVTIVDGDYVIKLPGGQWSIEMVKESNAAAVDDSPSG